MSRIHEAMKRAEQAKVASSPPEGTTEAAHPAGTKPVFSEGQPTAASGLAPSPVQYEGFSGRVTLEDLRARCMQTGWNPDERMVFFGSQDHVIGAEQFRKLRSRLYQLCEKQPLHTVLITSALPGEGKTFVAVNLAQAVVRQHERRALLIDADLRLSRLHHFLGAPSAPGLSDYLCGEADELSIVQRGAESNLFFIAGGRSVSNPTELIGNGRLNRLLQRLAPVFDWVILDSPPAIPVSDASMLAGMCDGVLLVIQAEATPFDIAQRARDGLRDKRLLGVVLNRVAPHSADAAHYFKYYYTKQENRKHAGYEKS